MEDLISKQPSFPDFEKSESQKTNELKKMLGVAFGIALVVGTVIGAGILAAPGIVAQYFQNYRLILACWVFEGIYVLIAEVALRILFCLLCATLRDTTNKLLQLILCFHKKQHHEIRSIIINLPYLK
jgi:hypothetical protein